MVLLGVLMAIYHVWPSWTLLALPLFTALALLASTGAGIWLAALNVKYRDFRYIVPFIVQFGLYISPVGFSSYVIRKSRKNGACFTRSIRWLGHRRISVGPFPAVTLHFLLKV